jgi:hypothetical protein
MGVESSPGRLPVRRRTFLAAAAAAGAGIAASGTQTGLGEREHLATPAVDLETHIQALQEHWDYREIDASHSPHVTAPEALAALLNSIIAKKPA